MGSRHSPFSPSEGQSDLCLQDAIAGHFRTDHLSEVPRSQVQIWIAENRMVQHIVRVHSNLKALGFVDSHSFAGAQVKPELPRPSDPIVSEITELSRCRML